MNLRGISRRVLAQHYALERAQGPRCKSSALLWAKAEAGFEAASSNMDAAQAAAPAWALCEQCPLLWDDSCRSWANTDKYTGLAAGLGWAEGVARVRKFGPVIRRQAS